MSKSEALAAVTAEGSINRLKRTPAWEKAFEAYNQAHPSDKKNMKCGHCFRTVAKWLQS